jgi:hypothetical protein
MNHDKNQLSKSNSTGEISTSHLRLVYSKQNHQKPAEKTLHQRPRKSPIGQNFINRLSALATSLEEEVEKLSSL